MLTMGRGRLRPQPEPQVRARSAERGRLGRARAWLRRLLAYLGAFAVLAIVVTRRPRRTVLGASPGPPFPSQPPGGSHVIDTATAFSPDARANAEELISPIVEATGGGTVLVYTQRKDVPDTAAAVLDAQALLAQWRPGGGGQNAAVLLFDLGTSSVKTTRAGLATGGAFAKFLPDDERTAIVDDSMAGYLATGISTPH